jgi:DNA (cytosine-5)-methyltransferase 1
MSKIKYISVCSGIEAASVAWHSLDWEPLAFSEIEPFPCAVLAHHWPHVPNHGDMTKFMEWPNLHEADLLVGGTPCQAFSVAGLRNSLSDDRGNLTLTYVKILNQIDEKRNHAGRPAAICVWENVPGVLNTKDNAFGCFLGALAGSGGALQPPDAERGWTNAGYVRGPQRAIAWRIFDAQYFGVAQRRRRVFVVSSARDGFDPAAVLFELEGVQRHTAPSREARENAAADAGAGFTASSFGQYEHGVGTLRSSGGDLGGGSETLAVCMATGQGNAEIANEMSPTLNCNHEAPIVTTQYGEVAGSLTARHDSSPRADRGQNIVSYDIPGNWIGRKPENGGNAVEPMSNVAPCLTSADKHAVAFERRMVRTTGGQPQEELSHCLRADQNTGDGAPCVAFAQNTRDEVREMDVVGALAAQPGMKQTSYIRQSYAVRRLTPTECERLQGFPDSHTKIPWRGKPAEECPDGPRYKACGNSMAVPCMKWIGERIQSTLNQQPTTKPTL